MLIFWTLYLKLILHCIGLEIFKYTATLKVSMPAKSKRTSRKVSGVHVVTTPELPGHTVKEVKGLVWGTSVRARFVGKDIIAVLRVLAGGEIPEYTEMINQARFDVIKRLVKNAQSLGANAVVGTKIGSTAQIIPGTVEIFAYGTAVVVSKK
jgi:uncharacterized protein YbjQ (UPF0145 family)